VNPTADDARRLELHTRRVFLSCANASIEHGSADPADYLHSDGRHDADELRIRYSYASGGDSLLDVLRRRAECHYRPPDDDQCRCATQHYRRIMPHHTERIQSDILRYNADGDSGDRCAANAADAAATELTMCAGYLP
jgi:hypothetical protein